MDSLIFLITVIFLVTNFFHHFDPPTCEQLMKKIHSALAPGGRCITLEFVPNDDRVSPPVSATFAMTMLASMSEEVVKTTAGSLMRPRGPVPA